MSVAKVLKLAEHRDRRDHRLNLARAFLKVDSRRSDLARHLADIASASGADRVAAVWVDEYGPGLIHPFVVLDLLADRPRRSFQVEPLRRAWEMGVPGAHDDVARPGRTSGSTFAIALGSDGTRAWFVVADSVSPRPPLDAWVRDRVMFLAGECSAIALHRDLDEASGAEGEMRFTGWSILADLEGREEDGPEARRVAQRFVVARIVRMFLDCDLVMAEGRVAELVDGARRELSSSHELEADERGRWGRVLEQLERRDVDGLALSLVDLGTAAEDRGHHGAAEELYSCAHGLAAAVSAPEVAADAARFMGRLLRRRAEREGSRAWYEASRDLALAAGLDHIAARALSGLATLVREHGNLPHAREMLDDALALAQRSGRRESIVSIHRDLASHAQSVGDVEGALRHGWCAVGASGTEKERMRCLASLAGALEQAGDLELATDAWAVVAEQSGEQYLQVFALDALAHISALRGDGSGFERFSRRCDDLGYDDLHSARAQILYYRGLSYRALGLYDDAHTWLSRAVAFAEERGFNEILFRAESDLQTLASYEAERAQPTPAAPPVVREGVRAMRRELVGAAQP